MAGDSGDHQEATPRIGTRSNNAARRVRGALSNDPDWARFVKHWILDGMTAEVTEDALFRAQGYMSDRMKGFPANYCMRIWGWD
jgi:hypothetical protein